jgi:hypothetical protein
MIRESERRGHAELCLLLLDEALDSFSLSSTFWRLFRARRMMCSRMKGTIPPARLSQPTAVHRRQHEVIIPAIVNNDG